MNQITPAPTQKAYDIMEAVIARGDLAKLTAQERGKYYSRLCASVGLNPYTRPFEYLMLSGKLVLYARKDCTDQLRAIHGVSVTDLQEREREGVFLVVAKVANKSGRTDVSTGAVSIGGLKGENLANALMKAETKAKRRATLSICGLGFLDGETELGDISSATRSPLNDELDRMPADAAVPSALEDMQHVDEPVKDRVPDLPTQRYQQEDA
jgi:hypothetical protein